MKNKSLKEQVVDHTDYIRSTLTFLMFIENKLINKRPYKIASLDMSEIDGFSNYMQLHMPE